jgi:hypothetical protein
MFVGNYIRRTRKRKKRKKQIGGQPSAKAIRELMKKLEMILKKRL